VAAVVAVVVVACWAGWVGGAASVPPVANGRRPVAAAIHPVVSARVPAIPAPATVAPVECVGVPLATGRGALAAANDTAPGSPPPASPARPTATSTATSGPISAPISPGRDTVPGARRGELDPPRCAAPGVTGRCGVWWPARWPETVWAARVVIGHR
jgi:hypothetical protein